MSTTLETPRSEQFILPDLDLSTENTRKVASEGNRRDLQLGNERGKTEALLHGIITDIDTTTDREYRRLSARNAINKMEVVEGKVDDASVKAGEFTRNTRLTNRLNDKNTERVARTVEAGVKSGVHLAIGVTALGLTIATGPGVAIVGGAFAARTGARLSKGLHRANQSERNRLDKLTTDSDSRGMKFLVGAANVTQIPERWTTNAVLGKNAEKASDKRRLLAHSLGAVAGGIAMFGVGRFLLRPAAIWAEHKASKGVRFVGDQLKTDTASAETREGSSRASGSDSTDMDKNNNNILDMFEEDKPESKLDWHFFDKNKESPNAFGSSVNTEGGPDDTFDRALARSKEDPALLASMLAEFDPKTSRADINNLINQMQGNPKLMEEKYDRLKTLSQKYDWHFEKIDGAYETEYMRPGPDGKINVYSDNYVNHGQSTGMVGIDKDGNKVQFRPECGFQPYDEKIVIPPVVETYVPNETPVETPPPTETQPPRETPPPEETPPPKETPPPTQPPVETPPPEETPPPTQPPVDTPPPTQPPTQPPTNKPKDPPADINVNDQIPTQQEVEPNIPAGEVTVPTTPPPVYETPPPPAPTPPPAPPAPVETVAPTPTNPGGPVVAP